MHSRFAFGVLVLGLTCFYSLLIYQLALFPFFGMEFKHYISCLGTVVLTSGLIFLLSSLYYRLYDHFAFLQKKWAPYAVGLMLSYLVLFGWDFFVESVAFYWITKLLGTVLFAFAFLEDPNSFRHLRRNKERQNR